MATATKTKSTQKAKTARKPAAKATPKTVKTTTPKSAKTTRKPATRAKQTPQERSVKNIVRDSAYATVGLTDTAVEVLKALPAKAAELREEAPVRVKSAATVAPKQLTERFQAATAQGLTTVAGLRGQVEQQLDAYASRGRTVVGKVQNSAATKRALEQSRVARAQVKAAATSVRKATRATADATEAAADKAGTAAAS